MKYEKRYVNSEVARMWSESKPAGNYGNKSGDEYTFYTDGAKLYSYELLIGDTCAKTGTKILRDYSAKGRWGFRSQTTSCHIGLAAQWADLVDS